MIIKVNDKVLNVINSIEFNKQIISVQKYIELYLNSLSKANKFSLLQLSFIEMYLIGYLDSTLKLKGLKK